MMGNLDYNMVGIGFLIFTTGLLIATYLQDQAGHWAKVWLEKALSNGLPGSAEKYIKDAISNIDEMMHGLQSMMIGLFLIIMAWPIGNEFALYDYDVSGWLILKVLTFIVMNASWYGMWFNPMFNMGVLKKINPEIGFFYVGNSGFDRKVRKYLGGGLGFFLLMTGIFASTVFLWFKVFNGA